MPLATPPEFYFDFGSPNAYLAHRVIPAIEQRTGASFRYVPVLLGGVFKATNTRSPAEAFAGIRNKLAYERLETERFVRRHGITAFNRNPPGWRASTPSTRSGPASNSHVATTPLMTSPANNPRPWTTV